MRTLLAFLALLAVAVQADDFVVDVYAGVPDSVVTDISAPISDAARFNNLNAPAVPGYTESTVPAPPPAPFVGLVRPPVLYAGVWRAFSQHYDHVVVFGGCVRVKVIVDSTERVELSGPVAANLNKIFTWVVNGVLYVRPVGISIADVSPIVVVVRVFASANVMSVTAHTNGIVTLVDATNPIAQNYQLFLYLYAGAQILQVRAVVYQINTYAYASSWIYIVGRCIRHRITAHVGHVDAIGLYTRYTDLAVWDSCFAWIRASLAITGQPLPLMVGGSSYIYYCVPPVPVLNVPLLNDPHHFYVPIYC